MGLYLRLLNYVKVFGNLKYVVKHILNAKSNIEHR